MERWHRIKDISPTDILEINSQDTPRKTPIETGTTMAYFLVRHLVRKYKKRNGTPEIEQLNEHEQQGPLHEDQLTNSNGVDSFNGDAVLFEKTPGSKHQGIPDKKRGRKHKQVPLCEHQLATTNGINGTNGDALLHEKGSKSEVQQIPDGERGRKHCPECAAEKKRARTYRRKLIFSLMVPNMMASMDITIVATALPTIASHFSMCSN